MWEQISNMIKNGQTYKEAATYVAEKRRVISDIYEGCHFDDETHEDIVWDEIVDACCDVMEEMKIDTCSDYCYNVISRCYEVLEEQANNGKLINEAIIKTISSFIKFLEDKSIGDWRDNLICEDDDDDMIEDDNQDE